MPCKYTRHLRLILQYVTLSLLTSLLLQHLNPKITFSSLIIIEPMVSPVGGDKLAPLRKRLVTSARRRRDTWPSRAEALMVLKKREGTKKWDEGVLKLFVVSLFFFDGTGAMTDEDVF